MLCWILEKSSTTNHLLSYTYIKRAASCPLYVGLSVLADLKLPCLKRATVMSNLSEIRVSIKFLSKLHIFSFKVEHRVAWRGIYHVYEYKYPYTMIPRTNLASTFSLAL